jgi:hypothetical protein
VLRTYRVDVSFCVVPVPGFNVDQCKQSDRLVLFLNIYCVDNQSITNHVTLQDGNNKDNVNYTCLSSIYNVNKRVTGFKRV